MFGPFLMVSAMALGIFGLVRRGYELLVGVGVGVGVLVTALGWWLVGSSRLGGYHEHGSG